MALKSATSPSATKKLLDGVVSVGLKRRKKKRKCKHKNCKHY